MRTDERNEQISQALLDTVAQARDVVAYCPRGHPALATRVAKLYEGDHSNYDGRPFVDFLESCTDAIWGCRFDHDELARAVGLLRALLRDWDKCQ